MVQRRLGVFALLLSALTIAGAAAQDDLTVIEKVRVVTGTGEVLEDVQVVIHVGKVVSIGHDPAPPGAVVISGEGMTVHAGFLDSYSNVGLALPEGGSANPNVGEVPDLSTDAAPGTQEANRNGITPELQVRDHLDVDAEAAKELRLSGFTTVLAAPATGYLQGQGCVVQLSGKPARQAVVAEPALLYAQLGRSRSRGGRRGPPGAGGGGGSGYPSTLMGIMAHVRQAFRDAQRLAIWEEAFRADPGVGRPPNDTALRTLQRAMNGDLSVAFVANTENEIHRSLDFAADWGLKPVLVGVAEGYKVLDRLSDLGTPVVVGLNLPDEPERRGVPKAKKAGRSRDDAEEAPDGSEVQEAGSEEAEETEDASDPVLVEPLKLFEERVADWEEQVDNVAVLLQSGVPICLTTRGSSPKDFVADLRILRERGVTEEQVLEALTTRPARFLGVDHLLGTVTVGRAANLVVVEGDLADKDRAVRHVFVDGVRFDGPPRKEKKEESGDAEAEATPDVDLTGKWKLVGEGMGQAFEMTLEVTQEDGKLRGTLHSDQGDVEILAGSVEGDSFQMDFFVETDGGAFEFAIAGSVDGDSMTASFEMSMMEEAFELTGTRIEQHEETIR